MERSAAERTVEAAGALLREKVERLSRDYPPHLLGEVARDELVSMRPQLEEALGALAEIERQRKLTSHEVAQRRAFGTLLSVATRLGDEA